MTDFSLDLVFVHFFQFELQCLLFLVEYYSLFDLLLVVVFTEGLDKHLVVSLLATLKEEVEDLQCVQDDVPLLFGCSSDFFDQIVESSRVDIEHTLKSERKIRRKATSHQSSAVKSIL